MADNQIIIVKDQAQANNVVVESDSVKTIKVEVGSPSNNVPTKSTTVTVETKPSLRISTIGVQGPPGPQGPPGFVPGGDLSAKTVSISDPVTAENHATTKAYVDNKVSAVASSLETIETTLTTISLLAEASSVVFKKVIVLSSSLLVHEESPGILSIASEAIETLLNAKQISCYVDGRYMNQNTGWALDTLGLKFEIPIPPEGPERDLYLSADIEYTFLWSY